MNVTELGDLLALINASLNAISASALVTGFVFIRRKVVDKHKRAMLTAELKKRCSGHFVLMFPPHPCAHVERRGRDVSRPSF